MTDRARLLERVAVGLAHEGKNPLHNMVLHLQLMEEKLATPERKTGSPLERHLTSLRDGIAKVDVLLRAFGEFASPEHLAPDLGAAVARCAVLFLYDARRAGVQVVASGPASLLVASDGAVLSDLVAHALVVGVELARDGGQVDLALDASSEGAALHVRATGGNGTRDPALPHLDALRRLAGGAGCELSIDVPPAGSARLSLSFVAPR